MNTNGDGLWSVGYEGQSIEEFVQSLVDAGIDVVADVRLNAISRKPGFSKTRLTAELANAGIEYIHLRGLGNPKTNRAAFRDGLEIGETRFRDLLNSEQTQSDLDQLAHHAIKRRVAVLCFERDEQHCHRRIVIEEISRRVLTSLTTF